MDCCGCGLLVGVWLPQAMGGVAEMVLYAPTQATGQMGGGYWGRFAAIGCGVVSAET